MTTPEDLSPEAKQLLRQAKGADRATRSEVAGSLQRFRSSPAPRAWQRPAWQPRAGYPASRRVAPWAVFVAILSGTLGAYATVGQSLGLPMPGWWPELATLPAFIDTATGRSTVANADARPPSSALIGGNWAPQVNSSAPTVALTPLAVEPTAEVSSVVPSEPSAKPTSAFASTKQRPSRVVALESEQPVASAERVAATSASAASPASAPGALAQEVHTITAARDALNAGNCAEASRHLDAHRLRFPRGALSEERQAISAICQCRRGEGTSAAAAYIARRSNSPLARRVATECGANRQ